MRGLLLSIAVFAAGLVPGVRAAHAQPPPGELNELILLLRPGETHPSPEEVVSAVNESRGLTGGLAEGDPFAAEHLLSRRAQGPLRDWIRENSEHPRSRLERYVVLSYHSPVDVAAIAESLEQSAHVEHAEVNRLLTLSGASAIPSDPLLDPSSGDPGRFQWAAQVMRLVEAAALARGGGTAGIIDRGLDPLHPDLRMFHREPDGTLVYDGGNFVDHMSRNLVDDTCDVDEAPVDPILDRAGHGDHVAGLLAATTDNDIGGMGAYPGCAFAVQKAFKADTDQGAMNNAAEALTELVGLGVQVVNMSFGVVQQPCTTVPLDLSALCQAIDLARRATPSWWRRQATTGPIRSTFPRILTR